MGSVTACMMDVVTEKSGHNVTGLAVSVCLTPAAPSPLPIPYPTFAMVSEGIIDECLRTKIDGAKVLTVGGCTKNCHGNEPGTLKEVVSLNTTGPCFPIFGAPIVFIELGMAAITLSPGFMNKNPLPGIGGSASGAGGGGGGGGGAGGGAGGPPGSSTSGPSNGGGGGGGSNSAAAPPNAPAAPGADGQANAGHPVDVVTGAMFTGPIRDFTLLGYFWVQFTRSYSTSSVRRDVGMGFGWSNALHWTARVEGETLVLADDEGRESALPMPSGTAVATLPYKRRVWREGADVLVELADGITRVLRAEEGGDPSRLYLAELRDREGHLAEIDWEGGEVTGVVDSVGRIARRAREGRHLRWEVTVKDAEGKEHRKHLCAYEIDDRGDLVSAVDEGGVETRYEYDEQHYMIAERRADGVVWHFEYGEIDGRRLCVETWGDIPGHDVVRLLGDPDAGTSRAARGVFHAKIAYGPDPFQSTVTDALGHVHRYWGNALGLVKRYLDPRGVDHLYTYDPNGNLVRATAGGLTEVRQTDAAGTVSAIQLMSGDGLRRTMDLEEGIADVRWSDGRRLRHRMEDGKTAETIDEIGRVHKVKRNEHGLPVLREVKGGGADAIEYDAHGNMAVYKAAGGATWKYTWDLFGLPVRLETPNGGAWELRYGSRAELVEVIAPDGQKTRRGYDALGRMVLTEHGSGGKTTKRYVADAMVEHVTPDGAKWRLGYDALLRLRWIENPAGERQRFEYDECGNLVREVTFGEVVREYERDALGRAYVTRQGKGSTTVVRDRAGRILRREHGDGQTDSFEYDAFGQLSRAVNGSSMVERTRNERGQLVRELTRAGGWEFAVDYEYNDLGQVTKRSYSTGWSVESKPSNLDGTLGEIAITTPHGKDVIAFERNSAGLETARRRVGGAGAILTERNVLGMPSKMTVLGAEDEVLRTRTFEWSKQGPVKKVTDSALGERKYELDDMGRPLETRGLFASESFRYTPHGIPVPADGTATVARGARPARTGDTILSWDDRGRLSARDNPDPAKSWRYAYDSSDRLIEAVRGDGRTVKYLYDALGRRLAATCAGVTTWFGWEGDTAVEEAETGGKRTYRVFAEDRFSPIVEGGDEGLRLVAHDGAGTPWLLLDEKGEAASLELSTWGEVAHSDGRTTPLRFGGQRADAWTGLHYNLHRWVAPDLRVFMTPDPLGFEGSPNEIGFVPNPTYYVDPLGLLTIIQASDDPVIVNSTQRLQAANPGSTVIHARDLQPNSLSNETQVIVNSHGAPGSIDWNGGSANGRDVAQHLQNAGFNGSRPGAQVAVTACNSATPGILSPSVAQGIADGTNAQTFGARSNSPFMTNLGLSNHTPSGRTDSWLSGNMGVSTNNNVVVANGQWGSVQPRPGGSGRSTFTPSTTGTTGTTTQFGTGTVFGP